MDLSQLRQLPVGELAEALDSLGLPEGWDVGDLIRMAASERLATPLPEPAKGRIQAFQNLVVGTIAERVFRDKHLSELEPDFQIVDYHEAGENRDFGAVRGALELPLNIKVASTMFRNAQTVVGLEPNDCVPISAYKAIGASERVSSLCYVDLVDFELRERVDAFMADLEGSLAIGWHLLSWYAGRGAKRAQDRYVNALFEQRADELKALPAGTGGFHVISAQRVLAILRNNPRRVPGLGVKGAGTGGFIGEVNVHISVREEMRPWASVATSLRQNGIQSLLDQIARIVPQEVPEPLL